MQKIIDYFLHIDFFVGILLEKPSTSDLYRLDDYKYRGW